jgi:hypothetical protein
MFDASGIPLPLPSDYSTSPAPTYVSTPPGGMLMRPYTPSDGVYPPAVAAISAGELSSDSGRQPSPGFVIRHQRRASVSQSPLAQPQPLSAVPRTAHRFNPLATPSVPVAAARTRRTRRRTSDDFTDDEDEGDYAAPPPSSAVGTEQRREEIRRQRIESEQRRRDELRDGYRRLKDALPSTNQKSSKVCLLDRATTHVKYLEVTNSQLLARVQAAESEVQRLRHLNEALMLRAAELPQAAAVAPHVF